MNTTDPFNLINLSGQGTQRGVTLALPTETVQNFLPDGMELGPQDVSPDGTHPIILFFHDMFRAHMSIPTLMPNLTYHEHSVGVPFTYVTRGRSVGGGAPGPYYYMPRLYLDSILATVGGRMWWGFAKDLGQVTVTANRYAVRDMAGDNVTSMEWSYTGPEKAIAEYEHFEPIRQILSQPIISMLPLGFGPGFILSNFDKDWSEATVRPTKTKVHVYRDYVEGYEAGTYESTSIADDQLGSYELKAPWRLSLPYPPPGLGLF